MRIPKPKNEDGGDGIGARQKSDAEVQLPQTLVRIPVEQTLQADARSGLGKGE